MTRIPDDKRYFRIGEASRIVGVEPYVLRYWESEFPEIRPKRADSNQRTYQREDLKLLLRIKDLLYDEKMTIKGARQRLKSETVRNMERSFLKDVKEELEEVLRILR